jgi:hypothetical protein
MVLSFEQRVHWYRLAIAALMVVAAFAVLGFFLSATPLSTWRLSLEARRQYVILECFLSAACAFVALRLKGSLTDREEPNPAATADLASLQVRTRWAAFRKIGGQLWLPADKLAFVPPKVSDSTTPVEVKQAAASKAPIENYDNADLARRAESDYLKIRRDPPGRR